MARYLVRAQYTVNLHTYVEADSQQEALDIGRELDGGEFKEDGLESLSDWVVYDAIEEE
jgi:hypothetical protein